MRAWVAEQHWLTLERLPAYAPELNHFIRQLTPTHQEINCQTGPKVCPVSDLRTAAG
jgi:hypothetical protein